MADNTQVVAGSGDLVRDIDRTGQPGSQAAKTQVVQVDVGGQYAESLVNPFNPVPTADVVTAASMTSDAPTFVAIAGSSSGDLAGVSILEKLVDDSGEIKMAVRVFNPPGKFDAQGAQVASDAPAPINLVGAVGQFIYIDTTGYQSISVSTPTVGGMAASVTASNDNITWASLLGTPLQASSTVGSTTFSAGGAVAFPALAKIIRFQVTTAGSCVVYLRSTTVPALNATTSTNVATIGANNVASVGAGLTGVMPVGGAIANGSGLVINPANVGGYDSGTPGLTPAGGSKGSAAFHQLLMDNAGRLRLAEESPVQSNQNAPALNVIDSGQFEDQDQYQLLAMILVELRINNLQLAELPNKFYAIVQSLQGAPTNQIPNAGIETDDPAQYRNDPSLFLQ